MTPRRGARPILAAVVATLGLCVIGAPFPRRAAAADPLAVVNSFCRADGDGARLRASSWSRVAPLVAWTWEPAWDHLILISGYQLSTPRGDGDRVEVDVQYTVTGEVHPGRIVTTSRLENLTYTLVRSTPGGRWLIRGPAHAPRVFSTNVDAHAMATLLAPETAVYDSASALVWRSLNQRADAALSYLETEALGSTAELQDGEPAPGTVALYYDGPLPYHAGIVTADGSVTSATLNAGVVTLPADSFAGEIRYRHLPAHGHQQPTPVATAPGTGSG